ncbi:MAG TPA: outer membrane protein transport protein [Marinobacterium sp.]|nr:outer membrane protein transport protein [Marinobacterium sp.]
MKNKSLLAISIALASQTSFGAGFYLKEQSIVSQGAAFAGAGARTDSASSVYFNPAGTAGMESMLEGGAHVLIPDQKVTGTAGIGALSTAAQEPLDTKLIPNFYYTRPMAGGVVGVGVSAPYGSTNEYDSNFVGALDSYYTSLKTIDLSASFAKELSDKVRVGAALVYQTADIEQRKLVSSVLLGNATTSTATLKGDSSTLTYTLGAQFDLDNGGIIGLSYKPAVDQKIKGTNSISQNFNLPVSGIGAIPISAGTYNASGTLKLPNQVSASAVLPISEQTDLLFDVTRYGWSAYNNLTVNTQWGAPLGTQPSVSAQNYKDTTSFALGMEHRYNDSLTVRAGVHFDPTPTNNTDRSFSTPDGDRTWLAVGASKKLENGWIWDVAYTHIDVDDTSLNRQVATGVFARAEAESSFNILSIGVRIPF